MHNSLVFPDIYVSIDGAHVKTGNTAHFDIWSFLKENGCIHISDYSERWQGEYKVTGSEYKLQKDVAALLRRKITKVQSMKFIKE